MQYKINLFALITNYFIILLPFSPILSILSFRFKEVRVTHFAIPSPKYFAPLLPILSSQRFRFKEVRGTHFAIPSPKYFAPLSPIGLKLIFRFKEVRVAPLQFLLLNTLYHSHQYYYRRYLDLKM